MDLSANVSLQGGGTLDMRFEVHANQQKLVHHRNDRWPHEPGVTALDGEDVLQLLWSEASPSAQAAVYGLAHDLALVRTSDGMLHVHTAASSPQRATEVADQVRKKLKPRTDINGGVVPVGFWTATMHGGNCVRRDIDVERWNAIEDNYPDSVELDKLMQPDYRPGTGGQLILWHGPPGTGKTTALRSLADAWREWCDLHYIVDPDAFFGNRADYMMEVFTSDYLEEGWNRSDGGTGKDRWRLLVLEDCGELLQPDARKEVGQALSRLLNACDGLIGRGLRILVLVTTNEPVNKLHEAVARPGRCASIAEFRKFRPEEAYPWLKDRGDEWQHAVDTLNRDSTLADLYAQLEDRELSGQSSRRPQPVGFAT